MKKLIKYRSKTLSDLELFWHKKCKRCNNIKPARTHHCNNCDRCCFSMDHHCIWINNCVGADNYRFFLNFLVYILVGLIYNLLTVS
mmetsp:Transcript_106255/g.147073  ORF Transcript_106255/g.147073 Transcript_106255/m.147073 type:complete len:86 (+) Transcript_106255:461-718(+)